MERRLVVDRDLLTRLYIAERDKENMAIQYFHVAVGFAGVVYVMSAVPALAAIKAPATINCADSESSSSGAAMGFGVGYSLTAVLRYLPAAGKLRL